MFLILNCFTDVNSQIISKYDSCATLVGKIVDANTKEPLVGASVVLLSISKGAATDNNGNYFILDIMPGLYNIEFSDLGYSKRIIENVLLKPKEKKTINFELPDWADDLALQADEDIKNGKIQILVGGMVAFCGDFDEVNEICKEFGFEYVIMGCGFLWESKYNEKVYKYLDEVNGDCWREKFEKRMKELCEEYQEEN